MFLNTWFVYVMASHRSLARDAHLQWHISYSFIDGNIISRRCAIYILVHISIYVAYYTCACVRCIRSPGYGQENWKTTVTRLQINCLFSLSLRDARTCKMGMDLSVWYWRKKKSFSFEFINQIRYAKNMTQMHQEWHFQSIVFYWSKWVEYMLFCANNFSIQKIEIWMIINETAFEIRANICCTTICH